MGNAMPSNSPTRDSSTGGGPSGHHAPDTGRTTSRIVMVALGAALLVGLALVGLLAFAATPSSALYGTARTPSLSRTASDVAADLSTLYNRVTWIAVVIFVLVQSAILYAALGFRRKSDNDPEPVQTHGNNTLEVIWTVVPSLIVLGLAFLSYREMRAEYVTEVPDDLVITATGYRWYWAFDYADKTLGGPSAPLTLTTSTELVIPVNRPVKVLIDSQDVIHSFWVPQLAGKRDAVPGARDGGYGMNSVWFEADTPGRYEGQCAELCGTWHSGMRFSVVALPEAEYAAWARAMAEVPKAPTDAASPAYAGYTYAKAVCSACHMLDLVGPGGGHVTETLQAGSSSTRGPNLTRVASRSHFAGGMFETTDENLHSWLADPQALKPGTLMSINVADEKTAADVIAFLKSLAIDEAVLAPVRAAGPQNVPNDLDGLGEIGGGAADEHGGDGEHQDEGDGEHDARAPRDDTHLASTLERTR
jgi:cytochrome c oxidase subunit 2